MSKKYTLSEAEQICPYLKKMHLFFRYIFKILGGGQAEC